ncbi:MAG: sialidase family protein [Anaerolineae bacterium]
MQKFVVSRDDSVYEAFPDVALAHSGKLVCVYTECLHHADRSWTRIMQIESADRGRTWGNKRPLTAETHGYPNWNCARIRTLGDGRLAVTVDLIYEQNEGGGRILLLLSSDEGATWSAPLETPARGIVPDRLLELPGGRWIIASHDREPGFDYLVQRLWYADDGGASWQGPVVVGRRPGLNLCEASILPVGDALVAFMRENSGQGWDCYKTISRDGGLTWGDPIAFPLPACHRPAAGMLANGQVLITHRFMQGGKGWTGWWTQNTFAGLTDVDSVLAGMRAEAHTRILPLDFDRSPASDTGYTGWVQFPDGEIYVVNYIMDDAPKAQIRGYALTLDDFIA